MSKEDFVIRESIILDKPRAAVWEMLVHQNGLKDWLHAQRFVITIDDGGLFETRINRAEKSISVVGETSLINPPEQLMFTWIERDDYGWEWDFPTIVSLQFEARDGCTRFTLSHQGLQRLPENSREEILVEYRAYWHGKMKRLSLESCGPNN